MSMSFDNWKWIAEKLGVPVLFTVILCLAIYRTGTWTATKVFEPLVSKHIEFLTTEQETMRSVAGDVSRQTELLKQIRDDQRKFPAVAEAKP
jgi:hypothetical protein